MDRKESEEYMLRWVGLTEDDDRIDLGHYKSREAAVDAGIEMLKLKYSDEIELEEMRQQLMNHSICLNEGVCYYCIHKLK